MRIDTYRLASFSADWAERRGPHLLQRGKRGEERKEKEESKQKKKGEGRGREGEHIPGLEHDSERTCTA